MVSLAQSVLILFFSVVSVVFLWGFIRWQDWKNFRPTNLRTSWRYLVIVCLAFSAIFWALDSLSLSTLPGLPYFLACFAIPFILSELNMQPFLRALLFTAATVGLTVVLPKDAFIIPMSSALTGLVLWKAGSNLRRPESMTMIDFLPPFVWLAGSYWLSVSSSYHQPAIEQGLLLGTLAVAFFLRWASSPLLFEDKIYLKRTVLSMSGGLMVLIVITKFLLADHFTRIAGLAAGGFLASYVLDSQDKTEGEVSILDAMKQLIIIGAFTLLGSRLFGCEGLLVLAATAAIVARSGLAQTAGIFFAARVLQQAFTEQYSSNVTGININHEYTGAALYFGFVLVICASVLLRDAFKKPELSWLFPFGAAIVSAGTAYLLHAEPTASFLVASVVAGIIFSVSSKSLYREEAPNQANLILWPVSLISFSLLFSKLLELGNNATIHERLYAVGGFTVVLIVASLISLGANGGFRGKTVEVSGDQVTSA
jgi:hypothetical protein